MGDGVLEVLVLWGREPLAQDLGPVEEGNAELTSRPPEGPVDAREASLHRPFPEGRIEGPRRGDLLKFGVSQRSRGIESTGRGHRKADAAALD